MLFLTVLCVYLHVTLFSLRFFSSRILCLSLSLPILCFHPLSIHFLSINLYDFSRGTTWFLFLFRYLKIGAAEHNEDRRYRPTVLSMMSLTSNKRKMFTESQLILWEEIRKIICFELLSFFLFLTTNGSLNNSTRCKRSRMNKVFFESLTIIFSRRTDVAMCKIKSKREIVRMQ